MQHGRPVISHVMCGYSSFPISFDLSLFFLQICRQFNAANLQLKTKYNTFKLRNNTVTLCHAIVATKMLCSFDVAPGKMIATKEVEYILLTGHLVMSSGSHSSGAMEGGSKHSLLNNGILIQMYVVHLQRHSYQ